MNNGGTRPRSAGLLCPNAVIVSAEIYAGPRRGLSGVNTAGSRGASSNCAEISKRRVDVLTGVFSNVTAERVFKCEYNKILLKKEGFLVIKIRCILLCSC